MKKERKKKRVKPRNPYALLARMKTGAGSHGHPKRRKSREKCRTRITEEEMRGE